MPKVKLFIATSLDGYIARSNGALDWLDELPNPEKSDFGYLEFYKGIDVVVMGRKTYEEVLGFDVEWPYPDCECYIISSNTNLATPTPKTSLISELNDQAIVQVKAASKKNIWLVGGGRLINSFLNNDSVDEMIISQIPRIIGGGIPLFPSPMKDTHWELRSAKPFSNGVVNLHYERKR